MTYTTSVEPAVVVPDAVSAINRAYLEACELITSESPQGDLLTKMADHMMYLARNGESDPERLCSLSVLAALGHWPRDAEKKH